MRPAGTLERGPRRRGGLRLAVDGVVAPFAEIERQLRAVAGMLEVATEVADPGVRRLVDPDEHDLPGDPLAADLKVEHRRDGHRGRHTDDVIASRSADLVHVPLGILKPGERVALEDEVREDAVDPRLHLVREAGHHRIDDDHRRHSERHADDARQRDPAGAEISPAEKEFVHRRAGLTGDGEGSSPAHSAETPESTRFPAVLESAVRIRLPWNTSSGAAKVSSPGRGYARGSSSVRRPPCLPPPR